MLSGRRKRDYEADSQAAQNTGDTAASVAGTSPGEAADEGVMSTADSSGEAGDDTSAEDEILVLA
jgi:hypothetical protein